MEYCKIVVTVPEEHADALRQAIGYAGGGQIGSYSHCSFSIKGTGRFLPGDDAKPAIGQTGKLEKVTEERIEITVEKSELKAVLAVIDRVHPYEEPAIDVYQLIKP